MYRIKKYSIAIGAMVGMTLVSLLIVSTLTYLFKWQADKAMIGIIVTYILAGFSGGITLKVLNKEKMSLREKGLEAFIVSNIFLLMLLALSIFVLQNPFEFSGRFLMIWGLLVSSTFLGRIL